jgi:signal transduction histidine kinase
MRHRLKQGAVAFSAWVPFFVVWVLVGLSFGRDSISAILVGGLISMGSAGILGIVVWYACRRWPWPLHFSLKFYLLQIGFGIIYGAVWTAMVSALEVARRGGTDPNLWMWATLGRELLMGIWFYAVFAGISHAIQTRDRLHEKETMAAQAEALATAARLDAIRARLNPHFLFNALHTLSGLVKFRPNMAEGAIERLGDLLRYTLKEDSREVVEFSEEYDFTREYLAFEKLRYEDRLNIDLQVDPESFNCEILPFSIQTLAENAVHHAISVRPEGGSISIKCAYRAGYLHVSVSDDGPGCTTSASDSHQFGLQALRERLHAAYGQSVELRVEKRAEGFEASFAVPPSRTSSGTSL